MAFRALPPAFLTFAHRALAAFRSFALVAADIAFLMPFFTAFLEAFLTRFTSVPVKAVIALSIPWGDADCLKLAHLNPHHASTES